MNIQDNINLEDHLVLDDCQTWPNALIELLKQDEKVLRDYKREENRIDEMAETDVDLRWDRPANFLEESWQVSLDTIREITRDLRIVGFHCTRLVDAEAKEILSGGLRPLSIEFSMHRIRRIQREGLIDQIAANALIEKNKINETSRKGKIAFFHCVSTLRNEHGLYRLFRSWGGEALYSCHERNAQVLNVLTNIGAPCIVIGSLNLSEISCCPTFEERFVNVWLDRDRKFAFSQDRDTFVSRSVRVMDIISRNKKLFEKLTGCSTWRNKI